MQVSDTLPKHIEAELAVFGIVPRAEDNTEEDRPQYRAWMPSYEGEQPPF